MDWGEEDLHEEALLELRDAGDTGSTWIGRASVQKGSDLCYFSDARVSIKISDGFRVLQAKGVTLGTVLGREPSRLAQLLRGLDLLRSRRGASSGAEPSPDEVPSSVDGPSSRGGEGEVLPSAGDESGLGASQGGSQARRWPLLRLNVRWADGPGPGPGPGSGPSGSDGPPCRAQLVGDWRLPSGARARLFVPLAEVQRVGDGAVAAARDRPASDKLALAEGAAGPVHVLLSEMASSWRRLRSELADAGEAARLAVAQAESAARLLDVEARRAREREPAVLERALHIINSKKCKIRALERELEEVRGGARMAAEADARRARANGDEEPERACAEGAEAGAAGRGARARETGPTGPGGGGRDAAEATEPTAEARFTSRAWWPGAWGSVEEGGEPRGEGPLPHASGLPWRPPQRARASTPPSDDLEAEISAPVVGGGGDRVGAPELSPGAKPGGGAAGRGGAGRREDAGGAARPAADSPLALSPPAPAPATPADDKSLLDLLLESGDRKER